MDRNRAIDYVLGLSVILIVVVLVVVARYSIGWLG